MDPDSTLQLLFATTRAIHFAACLLILSACVFEKFIAFAEDPHWKNIARKILLLSLPLALISGAAWFALVTMDMSGLPAGQALTPKILAIVANQTHFGTLCKWRSFSFVGACIALAISRRPSWILLLFSAALVASLAWAGHGQIGPGWHLIGDMVHLCVAACWPMGLLPFFFTLAGLRRSKAGDALPRIAAMTDRFSVMSVCSVLLLAFTGILNSIAVIGSIAGLLESDYGRILLLKLAAYLLMVGIGAINLLVLRRFLGRKQNAPAAARWLAINVLVELALLVGVLTIIAILGRTMPPQM